jgi:hypothetical protein
MAENRSLVFKFAQRPDPVLRAFGLRLTAEQMQAMLGPVLEAFKHAPAPMLKGLCRKWCRC